LYIETFYAILIQGKYYNIASRPTYMCSCKYASSCQWWALSCKTPSD